MDEEYSTGFVPRIYCHCGTCLCCIIDLYSITSMSSREVEASESIRCGSG